MRPAAQITKPGQRCEIQSINFLWADRAAVFRGPLPRDAKPAEDAVLQRGQPSFRSRDCGAKRERLPRPSPLSRVREPLRQPGRLAILRLLQMGRRLLKPRQWGRALSREPREGSPVPPRSSRARRKCGRSDSNRGWPKPADSESAALTGLGYARSGSATAHPPYETSLPAPGDVCCVLRRLSAALPAQASGVWKVPSAAMNGRGSSGSDISQGRSRRAWRPPFV